MDVTLNCTLSCIRQQYLNVVLPVGPFPRNIVEEIEYMIKLRQDWVRSITTYAFVSIFGLTVLFFF